jgi:hypothetical protein
MEITFETFVFALSIIGSTTGFILGILKAAKRWGLISDKRIPNGNGVANGLLDRAHDSPIMEIGTGVASFLRTWIVKTNPDVFHQAMNRVMALLPNHASTDNKMFMLIVQNDEELMEIVTTFYAAIREASLEYYGEGDDIG